MRYTRNLKIELKPTKGVEFSKTMTEKVLPMLKTQPGFAHELTMVRDDHVVAISVWDTKANADKYVANTYPKVLETLHPFINGQPVVENYELAVASL